MTVKKIIQQALLVVILSTILAFTASRLEYKIKAVDWRVLFIICLLISSIILFAINRLLSFMGDVMYLKSPLSKIDKMTGEEFECYLKARLKTLGYKVEITPKSSDYGADLFCFNKTETLVIQAKRYEGNVGNKAVSEIVGAKDYYEADRCAVITNSYFTINALNLAEANDVVLIDRDELLSFDYRRIHESVNDKS